MGACCYCPLCGVEHEGDLPACPDCGTETLVYCLVCDNDRVPSLIPNGAGWRRHSHEED